MKSPLRLQKGYTITELMVVLAISATLFVSALAGFSIQNKRTEFVQAVRELEVKIQDIMNDVATGYYPNAGNIECVRSGSPVQPKIREAAGTEQGTNNQCIFIGRAFDFRNLDGDQTDEIYTIVGLTHKFSDPAEKELSTNVEEAANRAIVNKTIPGAVDPLLHSGSIQITKVANAGTAVTLDGFAVISGFGGGDTGGDATGAKASIAKIEGYDFNSETLPVVEASDLNVPVTLCIEAQGGGPGARRATIKIGDGSLNNIQTTIDPSPAEWSAVGCT